ncbi:MAG TPA: alpha-glucan family phosphorylase [bacterium]|nr:alpha-glucan family phosphorylase [bacterium]
MTKDLTLTQRLWDIAMNLYWAWQPETQELFRQLDPDLWESTYHNPVAFLKKLPEAEVEKRGGEAYLNTRILFAHRRLSEYTGSAGLLGGIKAGPLNAEPVAYFSAEFGIHECLPIYSGGLGILAGDHLKAASDMGVPLVGVGLLYANGYFHQWVDANGRQQERYEANVMDTLPVMPALTPDGKEVRFILESATGPLHVKVWRVRVGRVRLFLMDTDVPENDEEGRRLTDRLYGGDVEKRLRQEIVLGIGGLRALRLVGIRPTVMHLNEGHCAFALLERTRERIEEDGLDFHSAWVATVRQTCFTTHTPVPAGHDRFGADLMEKHLGWMREKLRLDHKGFMGLGREHVDNDGESFTMTVLCLKGSNTHNAVSNLHGKVSRDMWQVLWPGRPVDEIPIGHVTNGVHLGSWLAPVMNRLFEKELGRDWENRVAVEPELIKRLGKLHDGELWETHVLLKHNLIQAVRDNLKKAAERRKEDPAKWAGVLDPAKLTIGFSRRFATYKRATLLLEDIERLKKFVNDPARPVQFIYAGKAHPADEPGKGLIKQLFDLSRTPEFFGKLVFVEDYDIGISRFLVQGVDVWLNNPERPLEACGTSGMKVSMNGNLNLSILDGWWDEAYDGMNGFAIGGTMVHADNRVQRGRDALSLYQSLDREVLPLYYDRGDDGIPLRWVARMKHTLESLVWRYSAARMVKDYMEKAYLPTAGAISAEL